MVMWDGEAVDLVDGIGLAGGALLGWVVPGNLAEAAGKAQETSMATRQNEQGRNIFFERVLIACPGSVQGSSA